MHNLQSVLVQNVAIINDGAAPVTLGDLEISLLAGGRRATPTSSAAPTSTP